MMNSNRTESGSDQLLQKALYLFAELRRIGTIGGEGITRECYSPAESASIDLIAQTANAAGLQASPDLAGNLWIELRGLDSTLSVVCGSHLDSVPHGGNFDGAAGVVSGLLCLLRAKHEGFIPAVSIKLVILRAEEGAWFGKPYLGSRTLFGKLQPADLKLRNCRTNVLLSEQLRSAGLQPERLCLGKPLIDPSTLRAFLELHIEQGPILQDEDQPFAVVTGIRGSIRHKEIHCIGQDGHSGAVPRDLRHDALTATADLLMRIDLAWEEWAANGSDLVVTSGLMHTDVDNAITRIPGRVSFSLDIRSLAAATLEGFHEGVTQAAEAIASRRGVAFHFDEALPAPPVSLNDGIITTLLHVSNLMGEHPPLLASGAGHDAAVFAEAGVPTGMIFVRNRNGSHNPHEDMDMDDFMLATNLLYQTLLELSAQ
jgi:N-carbamoyl-L-amino-acid hydrolase